MQTCETQTPNNGVDPSFTRITKSQILLGEAQHSASIHPSRCLRAHRSLIHSLSSDVFVQNKSAAATINHLISKATSLLFPVHVHHRFLPPCFASNFLNSLLLEWKLFTSQNGLTNHHTVPPSKAVCHHPDFAASLRNTEKKTLLSCAISAYQTNLQLCHFTDVV